MLPMKVFVQQFHSVDGMGQIEPLSDESILPTELCPLSADHVHLEEDIPKVVHQEYHREILVFNRDMHSYYIC